MNEDIVAFNAALESDYAAICNLLAESINFGLPDAENKIWHGSPVWFLSGNPIVGYSLIKAGVKLMFWSGMDFDEPDLKPGSGKFKDASIIYTSLEQIDENKIKRWIDKSTKIQWDYKNIVKRKGRLERLV